MPNVRDLKLDGIKLKPCPFCGCKAKAQRISDYSMYEYVAVGCPKCWCSIREPLGKYEQSDIERTIEKWNTRAAESEEG